MRANSDVGQDKKTLKQTYCCHIELEVCFKFNHKKMFGLFKKKTEKEKLMEQYKKLLDEAHQLSKTDRKASDLKSAEAEEMMKKIESLSS